MATTPSPIEQEIIDGLFYWDNLSPVWFRLIERHTHNVVGHSRIDNFSTDKHHVVTLLKKPTETPGPLLLTSYNVPNNGSREVEKYCKEHWLK